MRDRLRAGTHRLWLMRAMFVALPLFVCLRVFSLSVSAEDLLVRWNADRLLVSAPRLHFLTGRSLDRLRDGASVPFDFQLTVAPAGSRTNVLQRALERFVVSYDLWEQKFSVVRLSDLRRSALRMTASGAENWCLQNLSLSAAGLPADKDLWVRLDVRSGEPKTASTTGTESGISIAALIGIFSQPPRSREEHWALESGAFRLAELKR